jgi:hypothetical protein
LAFSEKQSFLNILLIIFYFSVYSILWQFGFFVDICLVIKSGLGHSTLFCRRCCSQFPLFPPLIDLMKISGSGFGGLPNLTPRSLAAAIPSA